MSASVIRVSLHVLGWDDASTSGFSCQLSWGAQITTHHQSDLEATAELSIISTWYSTLDPRLVSLFCLLNKRSALEKGYLPLTAIPSTAAMTGFRTDLMPVHRSSRYRRPRAASASRAEISLMSAPATRTSVSYRKCRGGTPGVWSRAWQCRCAWVGCGLFTAKETFAASDNNDSHATIPGCFLQLFQKHGNQLLGEGVALGWPVKGEDSDSVNRS